MKRAQGGMNAAVLIAVIAGLIMIYIIFLPSEEREAILENKSVDKIREGSGAGTILLREFPGKLDTIEEVDDKQLQNVFLYEATNAKELEKINPFVIRNGWFDKKPKTVNFNIGDIGNTDNVLLTFHARKHDGFLTITLNNEVVYEADVSGGTLDPIKLPGALLQPENILRFSVSSVGMQFWTTNEYQFQDMRIIADVTDKSNQESTSVFTLTTTELFNVEEADLRFVPYCAGAGQVGTLDISINSRNVFSSVPVCEDAYKQPLPLDLLKAGQNTITLKTSRGSYSVEQIRIEFDEEDIREKVYFFEMNASHFEDIADDDLEVVLDVEFVEDDELKRADINVNDRFFTLDQEDKVYTEDITEEVRDGNNFVEIIPRTELDIVEVAVTLKDK